MGGGTFVDGVRRWFKRRVNSTTSTTNNKSRSNANNRNEVVKSFQEKEEEGLRIVEDFDFSGLKFIRVPERVYFLVSDSPSSMNPHKRNVQETEFFTEYGEASRYQVGEVIGKGSYGVVGSAVDTHTGENVAIKKISDVFEHVSDATRILREIELLRLLRHPDIVEIKHIMLPPSHREFRAIYVVFELMESDLHQVIKANDDLTPEHYQFFLTMLLLIGIVPLSYVDLFFSKYTPAIDIWSIGCIFAEMLTGKPLFPGKNVVHQLDLMTDLLGTPPPEAISRIRNEKARRYLSSMRKKQPVPFKQKFPNADPLALCLLERLLAFDPKDRPTADEALGHPYFHGLSNVDREPSTQPISKLEFEFERTKLTKDDARELIYREILEYHPQMLQEYLCGGDQTSGFMYPSGVDRFKRQFAHLEEHNGKSERSTLLQRQHASLPRERVPAPKDEATVQNNDFERRTPASVATTLSSSPGPDGSVHSNGNEQNGLNKANYSARSLLKSASISASKCISVQAKRNTDEESITEYNEEVDRLPQKITNLHV
ncbi:mitogen-activated kinase 9 [Olea europaea subsp. europaea]|uniref:Mitogen-activated kinase 9 n=1 Tax=Olea europaea subsp. europaea TaxID=158383 RepID=A0A8S0V0P6_OLEEU|nr:mitogen-activated kinase 9 [Olea europaea subsp. europaea]